MNFLHRGFWVSASEVGVESNGAGPPARDGEGWIVYADEAGVGESLAAELRAAGALCLLARPDTLPPEDPDALRALVGAAEADGRRLAGIAHLWGLDCTVAGDVDEKGLERAVTLTCISLLHLIALHKERHEAGLPDPRFLMVTRGAQAVEEGAPVEPLQGPQWGLARVIGFEHPELRPVRLDLDPAAADAGADAGRVLAAAGLHVEGEELAFRGGELRVHRIRPLTLGPAETEARPDGAYLVTGGLGGLGLTTASWLAERGAGAIILATRHEPQPDEERRMREIAAGGDATVEHVCADVGVEADVVRVLDGIRAQGLSLRGVFHTAGAIDDRLVTQTDRPRFDRVLKPKAVAAIHLHRHTLDDPLDHFVLYSSGAALLGHFGQASYAAANAFLDALAAYRKARGLPALSVNWGGWRDVGYAARQGMIDRYERFGLVAVGPKEGMDALERSVASGVAQAACVGGDWRRYADMIWFGTPPPLLEELV